MRKKRALWVLSGLFGLTALVQSQAFASDPGDLYAGPDEAAAAQQKCVKITDKKALADCLKPVLGWWFYHGAKHLVSDIDSIHREHPSDYINAVYEELNQPINWMENEKGALEAESFCATFAADPIRRFFCLDEAVNWWYFWGRKAQLPQWQTELTRILTAQKQVIDAGEALCKTRATAASKIACWDAYVDWWWHQGGNYVTSEDPFPDIIRIHRLQLEQDPTLLDAISNSAWLLFSIDVNRVMDAYKQDAALQKVRSGIRKLLSQKPLPQQEIDLREQEHDAEHARFVLAHDLSDSSLKIYQEFEAKNSSNPSFFLTAATDFLKVVSHRNFGSDSIKEKYYLQMKRYYEKTLELAPQAATLPAVRALRKSLDRYSVEAERKSKPIPVTPEQKPIAIGG